MDLRVRELVDLLRHGLAAAEQDMVGSAHPCGLNFEP
jgi:hypothetical protein